MKKDISDEQLIEFIQGRMDSKLEKLIEEDADLKRRYLELKEVLNLIGSAEEEEVPFHIEKNIQQAVLEEKYRLQQRQNWIRVAAAVAILIIGFGIGRISGSNPSGEDLLALKEEIRSLKEMTFTSVLKQHSASERIQAVNQIEGTGSGLNLELIRSLINTLNGDESPNVRYAALQALANYMDEEEIRAELVKSLEAQKDPLIQISLITILVEAQEKSAIAPLKDLVSDEEAVPEVKRQASIAIEVLS